MTLTDDDARAALDVLRDFHAHWISERCAALAEDFKLTWPLTVSVVDADGRAVTATLYEAGPSKLDVRLNMPRVTVVAKGEGA